VKESTPASLLLWKFIKSPVGVRSLLHSGSCTPLV